MESWMFNVEMGRENTLGGCEQLAENSFKKHAKSNDTMKRNRLIDMYTSIVQRLRIFPTCDGMQLWWGTDKWPQMHTAKPFTEPLSFGTSKQRLELHLFQKELSFTATKSVIFFPASCVRAKGYASPQTQKRNLRIWQRKLIFQTPYLVGWVGSCSFCLGTFNVFHILGNDHNSQFRQKFMSKDPCSNRGHWAQPRSKEFQSSIAGHEGCIEGNEG